MSQRGSLILQHRGFQSVEGAWVPNWQFDAYCLESSLATQAVASNFALPLLPVEWHGQSPGEAMQIVAPTIGAAWFETQELRERTIAKHGGPGARCGECGVWRWYPLLAEEMPPYRYDPFAKRYPCRSQPGMVRRWAPSVPPDPRPPTACGVDCGGESPRLQDSGDPALSSTRRARPTSPVAVDAAPRCLVTPAWRANAELGDGQGRVAFRRAERSPAPRSARRGARTDCVARFIA